MLLKIGVAAGAEVAGAGVGAYLVFKKEIKGKAVKGKISSKKKASVRFILAFNYIRDL